MASPNRDVEVGISVVTAGSSGIRDLRDEVAALGKSGGSAAPEFERLSAEIDQLAQRAQSLEALEQVAQDVQALSTAQSRAAVTSRDLLSELAEASTVTSTLRDKQKELAQQLADAQRQAGASRDALASYKNEASDAVKQSEAYALSVKRQTAENIANRAAVRDLAAAYKDAKAATAEAAANEAALQTQFKQSAAATQRVTDALAKRNAALQDARAAVQAAGAASDDLSASNSALTAAVAAAVQETNRLVQAEKEQAAAAAAAGREEDRLAAIVTNTKRDLAAAAQQQLAVEKQVYAEMEAEQARLAAASRAAGQAIENALGSVGIRAAKDIEAEIVKVRESMDLLKATGALTGAELDRAMSMGGSRIKGLEADLRAATGQMTMMDRASNLLKSSVGQLAGAFTIVDIVQRLGTAFIDTNKKMESLRLGLSTVYKSTSTAADQINFLARTANTAGVSINDISGSFLKFSASMTEAKVPLQQTNDLFASVTRTAGTLGLSGEQVTHILDALGQMAAKGTVSMEELRQQLGDSLPGALSVAARGLGITEQQLVKLVESGGLLSRDLFPALTRGLQTMSGEVNTFSATWERLKNVLTGASVEIADSGAWNALKYSLATTGVLLNGLVNGFSLLADSAVTQGRIMVEVMTGNLKDAGKLWDDFVARQAAAGEKLQENAKLLYGLGDAATASATGQKAATAATTAQGQAAQQAAGGVQANATAQQAAATGAGANATAQQAAGAATAAAGTTAVAASGSWQQLSIAYDNLAKNAEKAAVVKEKLAKATAEAGQAAVANAALTGNERTELSAAAFAAQDNVRAQQELATVRRAGVQALESTLEGLKREAAALGDPDGSRAKYIADVQKTLDLRHAESEQAESAVKAAQAEAASKALARQAYEDNSTALVQLKKAMEDTAATAVMVAAQEKDGFQTKEQVAEANRAAAKAEGLYNDALRDSVSATERSNAALQNRNTIAQRVLETQLRQAQNSEALAHAMGNETLAIEEQVRQREIQIQMVQANAAATRAEADATIKNAESVLKELADTGQLTPAKQAEQQARIDNAKAKKAEADGSSEVVKGIELEIDAMRRLSEVKSNRQALGVIGPNQKVGPTDYSNGRPSDLSNPNNFIGPDGLSYRKSDGAFAGSATNTVPLDKAMAVEKAGPGKFGVADIPMLREAVSQALNAKQYLDATRKLSAGVVSTEATSQTQSLVTATKNALDAALALQAQQEQRAKSTTHTVNFNLPDGSSQQFGMTSEDDAARFMKTMETLSTRTKR